LRHRYLWIAHSPAGLQEYFCRYFRHRAIPAKSQSRVPLLQHCTRHFIPRVHSFAFF
jgi:hypothetical protein